MHKLPSLLVLAFCALGAYTAAQAEVYKWVDSDGVTHYSQQPPDSGGAQEMKVPGPSAAPAPSADSAPAAKARASDLSDEIRARRAEEDRQQAEAEQARTEACAQMRKNAETLRNHARVRVAHNGSTRVLSPEEQARQIIDLEKQIQDNCS